MGNNPGYLMEEVHGFIDHSVDIVFDIYYHARNQDFMRALDVFFRYAKGTWTDKGYRQVVVWTLAYFLMVITLILVMELLPKLKLNVRYFGAAHNFAMSMFSAWMFYGSALTWYDNLKVSLCLFLHLLMFSFLFFLLWNEEQKGKVPLTLQYVGCTCGYTGRRIQYGTHHLR